MSAEFEAITTQEAFDQAIKNRLERAAKKYEGYTSPDDLATIKQGYETTIADLRAEIDTANKKVTDFETVVAERDAVIKGHENRKIREKVAISEGLGYEAAEFLKGDSEDDIRASAESLKTILGARQAPTYTPNEGVTTNTTMSSLQKVAASLSGN